MVKYMFIGIRIEEIPHNNVVNLAIFYLTGYSRRLLLPASGNKKKKAQILGSGC
jgi:hypothetical protein